MFQQVCVEPRLSPLSMTLPIFAAERARSWYVALAPTAIDQYLRAYKVLSSKPASRCCCLLTGQTDGHTDTRPLHRQCVVYIACVVSKLNIFH